MAVMAVGMGLLAASATRADLTVLALAVTGAGMGLFVAANNAATMFAAPPTASGRRRGSVEHGPRPRHRRSAWR